MRYYSQFINYKEVENYIDTNGCKVNVYEHTFNPKMAFGEINTFIKMQDTIKFDQNQFKYLSKINTLLSNNNIKTIYFTLTFSVIALRKFNLKFMNHQKKILKILNYYYDLSYIPYISNDNNKFSDFVHSKFEALKHIFTKMNLEKYKIQTSVINNYDF